MEVRAKAPHRLIQAFTGQRITSHEWFTVPDGGEEEARRLVGYDMLELREDKSKAKPAAAPEPVEAGELKDMTYRELQALASDRGIPSVGVKKAELVEALSDE